MNTTFRCVLADDAKLACYTDSQTDNRPPTTSKLNLKSSQLTNYQLTVEHKQQ